MRRSGRSPSLSGRCDRGWPLSRPGRAMPLSCAPAAPAARLVRGERVGHDRVGRLRGGRARARAAAGRARNAEGLALRRYRVAAGVGRHRRRFRANIGAACFETSTSMRSRRFSCSSSMMRFCSGARLSAACGEPAASTGSTRLSTVLFDGSCPSTASALGFPALTSPTICRSSPSARCLGCFGPAVGPSRIFRPSRSCPA